MWKYCENIMVTFLKIFYSLYHLSFLNLLPIHTFFFFFFLFFSSTRCHLYLLLLFALSSSFNNIPSFQLVQVQFSFSSALSLSLSFFFFFFFLNLFQRALWTKYSLSVFHAAFSSRFGETKFVGPEEKIFSRIFHSPYFPLFPKQWKTMFSTQFSPLCFPSP